MKFYREPRNRTNIVKLYRIFMNRIKQLKISLNPDIYMYVCMYVCMCVFVCEQVALVFYKRFIFINGVWP